MAAESAYTSVNQIASVFKDILTNDKIIKINFNFSNLDIGAGKYNAATNYLNEKNILNFTYDPYNLSKEHNEKTLSDINNKHIYTITCANVFNVIKNQDERFNLLNDLKQYASKHNSRYIIIQIYQGDKSGIISKTTSQMNQTLDFYYNEIKTFFNINLYKIEKLKSKYIIIQPFKTLPFIFQ